MRLQALLCAAAACSSSPYVRQGPTVSSIPAPPLPTVRTEGPLSLKAKVPETPWSRRQQLMRQADSLYLDRAALHEDGRRFLQLVAELIPTPPTPELATGVEIARRDMALIEKLAPYSLDAVSSTFISNSRLPLCARPPGQMWHCWTDLVVPSPASGPPFELVEPAPGILKLVIRDLANASDPAWTSFPAALDRIASARGIVLDLRDAAGADPRPLVPLLEQLTRRAPFRPLRAIRRPAELDPYVADYARRFLDGPRDRDVWAGLVGTMPPARAKASAPPLAVVVGRGCGAACELAARSLVTYAGATLFGDVQRAGRLERDEPALLVLPRSKIEIYFQATEYLLDEAIERATGPTAGWWQRLGESYRGDLATFAVHELEQRVAGRPPPRCDSYPGYASADQLPPALRTKLRNAGTLGDSCRLSIRLKASAPLSAMLRFGATCTPPIRIFGSFGMFHVSNALKLPELSRLAGSDLVERIEIDCEHEDRLR